jgi:hypothetical protein
LLATAQPQELPVLARLVFASICSGELESQLAAFGGGPYFGFHFPAVFSAFSTAGGM